MVTIQREQFDTLLSTLSNRGFAIVGPTHRDGAIVLDEISSAADLPTGWGADQAPGSYRLRQRSDQSLFGYPTSPQSWKKFLFPPVTNLMTAVKKGKGMEVQSDVLNNPSPSYALLGVRSCEVHALAIHDRVFAGGDFSDPTYAIRRRKSFIIAVNCTEPGGTCFCVSMKTGPKVNDGYDIVLTEVVSDSAHYFLAEAGTDTGESVLGEIAARRSTDQEVNDGAAVVESATLHMGRSLETDGIEDLLMCNLDNAQWEDVEKRCLMCANCTMVCPTCFCSTVDDVTSLSGDKAGRVRRWDSCFALDFAKVTGGNFRFSPRARYRQWMTHKLSTWKEQFGTLGCVGCGRCITWCPVGIDITEEAHAIRTHSVRLEAQHNNGG
jgi:ferredoxin